jgi:hypothetical protein
LKIKLKAVPEISKAWKGRRLMTEGWRGRVKKVIHRRLKQTIERRIQPSRLMVHGKKGRVTRAVENGV